MPAPVNSPPPAGRSTRSSTRPPALPELIEKLVTVPSNGTCSAGASTPLNGAYVQLMLAKQMFVVGLPVVLPSVTVCAVVAAPAAPPPDAMTTAATTPATPAANDDAMPRVRTRTEQAYQRTGS